MEIDFICCKFESPGFACKDIPGCLINARAAAAEAVFIKSLLV
jgi:hypothetical protein